MTFNVARKLELEPEDIERGARMKALRLRWQFKQRDIVPDNHTQVTNVEAGKNKLGGPLLLQYAAAFGVDAQDIAAYARGQIQMQSMELRSKKPPGYEPTNRGPTSTYDPTRLSNSERRLAALAILTDKHRLPLLEGSRALDAVEAFDQAETADIEHWAALALKIHANIRGKAVPDRVQIGEFEGPGKPKKRR